MSATALSPPPAHSATSYTASASLAAHYSAVPTVSSNYGYGGRDPDEVGVYTAVLIHSVTWFVVT